MNIMNKEDYLKTQRTKRIMNLIGKCVIIAESTKNPGEVIYIQDQKLSQKGFWTKFMANARGFDTAEDANLIIKKLKYNNPRIMWVS